MPVSIQWLVPDHILFTQYRGDVTAADIRAQYQQGIVYCEASQAEFVHMLVDVRNVTSFPMNVNAYKDSFGSKATNAGWVILVGNNPFMRFITTVVSNIMHLQVAYLNEMEAALQYLAQRDSTATMEQLQDSMMQILSSIENQAL